MNRAVVCKTLRDSGPLLALVLLAIVAFEMLIVLAMGRFAAEITDIWFRFAFVKNLIRALLGADLAADVSATSLVTLGLAHPLLYALSWSLLLATGTRVIVGEVERGTADLLLTLPNTRAGLYASFTVVWLAAAALMSAAPWLGLWLGQFAFGMPEPLRMGRLALAGVNLWALLVAIGALTMLASAVAARRGRAIAAVLGLLLASFLLNFLALFVPAFERVSFLGALHYYRPLEVVRSGRWPLEDLAVLAAVALCAWVGGLWWFCRRDIPAA